jgi:predicted DNA-binding transcriptional regulator AlpA
MTDPSADLGSHTLRQRGSSGAGSQARAAVVPMPVPRLLLTDEESAAALGMSVRKFRDLADEPYMCKPVQLGPRMLRWSLAELQDAIGRMPRQVQRSEPAELARSRIERMKRGGAPP